MGIDFDYEQFFPPMFVSFRFFMINLNFAIVGIHIVCSSISQQDGSIFYFH